MQLARIVAAVVLTCAALAGAQTFKPLRFNPVSSGATYPDITFWLNFEANDTTGDYNMGASECSDGDTSGAYSSSATIESTGCKVGTYCLYASSPDGNDFMTFVVSSNDIVSGTKGRLGLWFKVQTWETAAVIVDANFSTDANNYFFVRTDGADELLFRWRQGATTQVDATSTTANISTGTWYFLEIKWDSDANSNVVYINGSAIITDSTNTTAIATLSTFHLGYSGGSNNFHIDNAMVSNDPSRTFYTNGTSDLSVATSKPSGACS